jgi:hypothetical protein
MKPENILLKQQGRSGIKVAITKTLIDHKENNIQHFWQLPYLHKKYVFSFSFL